MAQTLTMRATSLAASTALLALASIAAFSLKWAVALMPPPSDGPIIVSESEPVAPTPSHPIQPVRPADPTQPLAESSDTAVTTPISTEPANTGFVTPNIGPPTISNPHWLQTPRDLARYYPMMALRRDIEGEVQLDCLVTTTGSLQCAVASETPTNWGFGAAAIRIAQDYRMVPAMRDGAPAEARYRMRVPFRLNR